MPEKMLMRIEVRKVQNVPVSQNRKINYDDIPLNRRLHPKSNTPPNNVTYNTKTTLHMPMVSRVFNVKPGCSSCGRK